MEIVSLGHSSFRIKSKDTALVTDPFDSITVGFKFPSVEANIVTVSHEHKDHNFSQAVKGNPKVISGPGEYEIGGISILGFPTFHDEVKGEERGKNIIYVIEVEGVRICHLGDLGEKLSDSLLEDLGDVDILFIPVGGEYTVSPSKAVEIVQAIEAPIVIPMHYLEPGINNDNFGKLAPVDSFLKEVGLAVETLPKLVVKKFDIDPETHKVVILERK